MPGYSAQEWCGNAGWFPGYPLLTNLLMRLDLPGPVAGFLVSHLFLFLIFLLIWNGFFERRFGLPYLNSMLLIGFFPGSIYYQAVFPISMFVFFCLASIYFAVKRKWTWTGIAGFVAAATYPTGFLLSFLSVPILVDRTKPVTFRLRSTLKVVLPTLLGLTSVFVIHQVTLGAWDAFLKIQAKYGHGVHNPIVTLLEPLRAVLLSQWDRPFWLAHVQTAVVLCLLFMCIYACKDSISLSRTQQLATGISLTFWMFPLLVGKEVHLYRQESLLLPLVLLFPQLPVSIQIPLLLACIYLKYQMAVLFFHGILV